MSFLEQTRMGCDISPKYQICTANTGGILSGLPTIYTIYKFMFVNSGEKRTPEIVCETSTIENSIIYGSVALD